MVQRLWLAVKLAHGLKAVQTLPFEWLELFALALVMLPTVVVEVVSASELRVVQEDC
jgi:hypothetical protein